MKLAFCLFNYFPFGGLQRDFLRIAEECVRRGHTVDVYTMCWQDERNPQFTIHVVPVSGWQNHTRCRYFVKKIQAKLDDYDLVVGFNKMPGLDVYYAADTCYQAKMKTQRHWWNRLTPRYRHLIHYEQTVFAIKNTPEILLIAPKQQIEFIHYYHTAEKKFHLLPPGIARDRIAPLNADELRQATRQKWRIGENEFLLLMVGSGFKTKGLDRILLAQAALPSALKNRCRLFVIGSDDSAKFKQQAEQLSIADNVIFLGGRSDVADFLLAADLLLHPAYNENTGTVLLEALVSGLPVLTTDVCGYAHYIQQANAGLVLSSPFQQAELNTTLADMLLSPLRAEWKKNAVAFSQHADIYSMPQRAVDIIESLR